MDTFEIVAPARLHFGLFAFGDPARRRFGGVGTMLDEPALRLRFTPAESWIFLGRHADRIGRFVEHALERSGIALDRRRAYQVETLSAPPDHVGLGSGTQLGLSAAYGALYGQGTAPCLLGDLMRTAGRGKRSSVGGYGFVHGGLIIEAGKLRDELPAPLIAHATLPLVWRVLLVTPKRTQGLHGGPETTAFEALPPVSQAVTDRLIAEATLEILPAVREADFARFSESVYRYGHRAGECFVAAQGGPYADARIADIVARLRSLGVAGVGQSSWGPTIFAWFVDEYAAQDFSAQHEGAAWLAECDLRVVRPAANGAMLNGRPIAERLCDGAE
ncbi:MAG: hypothetical protein QM811_27760 [Pirellulales bacterium]